MPWFTGYIPPSLKFRHPTALYVTGTTGAGKSRFIYNTIEKKGIRGKIKNIYYFMPRYEKLDLRPLRNQKVFLFQGIPTKRWLEETLIPNNNRNSLIIIDDQWTECANSGISKLLITWGRRHLGVSLIFVSHSFFEAGAFSKVMR